jgi:hypothetical protein
MAGEARRVSVAYPSVARYAADLPDGWSSFPSCQARASLLSGLRARGAFEGIVGLPVPLQRVVDGRLDGEWIPEVLHIGALLAVRDTLFAGEGGDDGFLEWMAHLNRQLMASPEHADVFEADAPVDVVRKLSAIWARFHRGISMQGEAHETHARAVLSSPRALLVPLSIEWTRRTLAVALAQAGAAQPEVTAETAFEGDEARTTFSARWQNA